MAKELRSPPPSKTLERKLGQETKAMVRMISKLYENQVLNALNVSTIEKFHDAQTGNYAAIAMQLNNRLKAKVLKRYSNKRIKGIVADIMKNVRKQNGESLYGSAEKVTGVPVVQAINSEGLSPEFNAMAIETEEWIKKLRDDHLIAINNNSIRMMKEGRSITDITKELGLNTAKARSKAQMVARQQVSSYNGLSSKIRYQKLGVKKAIWVTAMDERVRPCHRARNKKEFELSQGLYSSCDNKTLYPGTDYNCRCTYKVVIEDD